MYVAVDDRCLLEDVTGTAAHGAHNPHGGAQSWHQYYAGPSSGSAAMRNYEPTYRSHTQSPSDVFFTRLIDQSHHKVRHNKLRGTSSRVLRGLAEPARSKAILFLLTINADIAIGRSGEDNASVWDVSLLSALRRIRCCTRAPLDPGPLLFLSLCAIHGRRPRFESWTSPYEMRQDNFAITVALTTFCDCQ